MTRAPRFRCHTCGATHVAYLAAERHADSHGGGRIELLDVTEAAK